MNNKAGTQLLAVESPPSEQIPVDHPQSLTQPTGPTPVVSPRSYTARPYTARRRLIHVLLVVGIAWSAVMVLRQWVDGTPPTTGSAPDFTLTTFDGKTVTLHELRGQGVVLNFWASWCGPCRVEAAHLEAAARQEAGNGVIFVGINHQDHLSGALAYMDEFGVSYPNGPDLNRDIARSYGVRAIPDTIFIDAGGQIQGRIQGPVPNASTLETYLQRIRPES